MKPLYFGDSSRPLFGIYHPPSAPEPQAHAVLLCNPFGQEAIMAHRIFRVLGTRLSRAGFPVLRFDYFGTGDSSGDSTEGSQGRWIQDIRAAHDALRHASQSSDLGWVGLRYGASLALLGSEQPAVGLSHLVLWDPVHRGEEYLGQLWADHCTFLGSELSSWKPASGFSGEALGFPITSVLERELRELDLSRCRPANVRRISIVASKPDPANDRLLELLAQSSETRLVPVTTSSPWNSEEALNSALVPLEIVNAIVALVGNQA